MCTIKVLVLARGWFSKRDRARTREMNATVVPEAERSAREVPGTGAEPVALFDGSGAHRLTDHARLESVAHFQSPETFCGHPSTLR